MSAFSIEEAVERGKSRWPSLELDEEPVRQFLEGKASQAKGGAASFVEDLYLAFGCTLGLPEALRCFNAEYGAELERAARQSQLSAEDLADLKQLVHEKLFTGERPRIADYGGTGP